MNGNLSEMGQYIAEKRAEKGLTQQQLADRLHVTNKAVSKWETGRGLPDIQMLEPLSEALGVTPAELLRCGPAGAGGGDRPGGAPVFGKAHPGEDLPADWLGAGGAGAAGWRRDAAVSDHRFAAAFDVRQNAVGDWRGGRPDVDSGSRGVCLARMARVSAASCAAYRRAFVYSCSASGKRNNRKFGAKNGSRKFQEPVDC